MLFFYFLQLLTKSGSVHLGFLVDNAYFKTADAAARLDSGLQV
jgi:hypothetical protein